MLINKKEIRKIILFYENQISILNRLLDISDAIEKVKPLPASLVKAATPAKGKSGATARKTRKGAKRKRGALTTAILDMVAESKEPLKVGDIKSRLVTDGLVEKSSMTVYSTLAQLSKAGRLKKAKTSGGIRYSSAKNGAKRG